MPFEAGERRAKAVMHSLTKCHVRIRFPPEVEPVRMLELLLVAVGRGEDSEDQLTTRNLLGVPSKDRLKFHRWSSAGVSSIR